MSDLRNDAVEELVINRIAGLVGGTPRRVDDGSADGLHDHEIVRKNQVSREANVYSLTNDAGRAYGGWASARAE